MQRFGDCHRQQSPRGEFKHSRKWNQPKNRQHVGKTTASLGIISGLRKRFKNVGFIKPVGQQHERTAGGILVDKVLVVPRVP